MATTTILHEYERRLEGRKARKEISKKTADSYLNDASRVFEVLLLYLPVAAIQGYMEAAGYSGDYGGVIESLAELAREPGHASFGEPLARTHAMSRRKRIKSKADGQKALPGL